MTVVGGGSRTGAGVDRTGLLKDLKKQVAELEDDLRERSESVEEFRTRLEAEYARAYDGKRTAATYGAWRDERVTQAAAAWVLACVFVRFCEDNQLIEWPFLAGPGERLRDAEERHEQFFREKPHLNNRDWLIEAFQHLADANETAAGLFDRRHNPLWELTPSYEAATELLAFWRRRGADGEILYDFTDEEWDTRFLGDLYQDLSEHARKTYALLQTPEFVEEFILDLTLEPAIEEFGLAPEGGLRTIDPACGSGHFLLGIFARLVEKWRAAEPGTDEWTVVRRALDSVHGCDKNPFAVSIARFRLLVAAMRAAGAGRLVDAPAFPINVAVGDSLLHGRGAAGIQGELDLFAVEDGEGEAFQYATEDVGEFAKRVDLLGRGSYHVVVGNPPYIEVNDDQEIKNYRTAYCCSGKFPLSVPFAQRFFELAIRAHRHGGVVGHVGQITSNSFMKRTTGKRLVETFLSTVEVTHVIDAARAYIPGHNREGTPTAIIVGLNKFPRIDSPVCMISSLKGAVSVPDNPAIAPPWVSLTGYAKRGEEGKNEWVAASLVDRVVLASHPWIFPGSGKNALREVLARNKPILREFIDPPIGRAIRAGADEAFTRPLRSTLRTLAPSSAIRPFITGRSVRDWRAVPQEGIWYPYDPSLSEGDMARELWPWRALLTARRTFQGTMSDAGLEWWMYMQHTPSAYENPVSLIFAFKASHNHFTLDRGGSVFNRHSPVIKLPNGAEMGRFYSLLAILNSSTCCFLMKESAQHQGGGAAGYPWSWTLEFTGGIVERLPVPESDFSDLGKLMDELARSSLEYTPAAHCAKGVPSRISLRKTHAEYERKRRQMIALQEELDWQIYHAYGLLSAEEARIVTSSDLEEIPGLKLGERAFEIALARKTSPDGADTAWFERHGSVPIKEVPSCWPDWYQKIVQARIEVIEKRGDLALIERPDCKRRWEVDNWKKEERSALCEWLLARIDTPEIWRSLRDGMKQPRLLTVSQIADVFRDDAAFKSVAELYAADHLGKPDLALADVLAEVIFSEHVPYLAAMRYTEAGLRSRNQWEEIWERQREEDRQDKQLINAVPPKYKPSDFMQPSYWAQRGKLDVPRERFISYPEASPDADSTLLLGWAGWDHKDQAQVLFNLIEDRTQQAGWGSDRIKPLLAGLLEIMPWVHQWHGEYDPEWEAVPADEFQAFFEELCAKHHVSEADLRAWRPEKKTRGRKKATPKKKAAEE